ncbi:hypothetical protein CRP01_09280 [Flavilitoribacter nigricans DSM 23189 = NBRC 102662]|uniref:Uncharacterized protein n=1 Tax=Flavilitoribacter nigricans (strain ATCC 23147 / DSM 23189 / NBRC 102662 / NCIMB 1420 / SS-2) TaxID=1122177 RepID=A0A2D0NEE4_FLAN2|nr:hypothetical protein CRP01_09280 [Flavilitoribacter nigricans DSM 23189 = NBRC 102662]
MRVFIGAFQARKRPDTLLKYLGQFSVDQLIPSIAPRIFFLAFYRKLMYSDYVTKQVRKKPK